MVSFEDRREPLTPFMHHNSDALSYFPHRERVYLQVLTVNSSLFPLPSPLLRILSFMTLETPKLKDDLSQKRRKNASHMLNTCKLNSQLANNEAIDAR